MFLVMATKENTMKQEKTKPITFKVPASLHRALRMRAAKDDATIQAVAAAALHSYLMRERVAS